MRFVWIRLVLFRLLPGVALPRVFFHVKCDHFRPRVSVLAFPIAPGVMKILGRFFLDIGKVYRRLFGLLFLGNPSCQLRNGIETAR